MAEENEFTFYRWWRNNAWVFYQGELWYIYRGYIAPFNVYHVLVLNRLTFIRHGAFNGCSYLQDVYVPDSVTDIGHHAFFDCTSLTTISMPNLLTSMGPAVFSGCYRLENLVLPISLTKIPRLAFTHCSHLSRLHIPPYVTEIGSQAFCCCSRLTSMKLPRSVSFIGYKAFYKCKALEAVKLPINAMIHNQIFKGCRSLRTITLFECDSSTNNNDNNMFIVLDTHFCSSQGSKTIEMPNITATALWPRLLKQLDGNNFFGTIGVSNIGRKTAMFSFLQQNMSHILEVA